MIGYQQEALTMILGHLNRWNLEKNAYSPLIHKAMDYLLTTDFSRMPNGKYEIEGQRLFALLQESQTEAKSQRKPESHNRYTDIQYLISGEEKIVYASREGTVVSEQDDSKDLILYKRVGEETELVLHPGMYAIFYPEEIHRPCCLISESARIRKVVMKVDLS
jgi:biofilm protein TabA